jgi:hypothetical protein
MAGVRRGPRKLILVDRIAEETSKIQEGIKAPFSSRQSYQVKVCYDSRHGAPCSTTLTSPRGPALSFFVCAS